MSTIPHPPSMDPPIDPVEADPVALALDVYAMLDEAPSGRAWTGAAAALADTLRAVLDADGSAEGQDPCACHHAYNRHRDGDTEGIGCLMPGCRCTAYAPDGFADEVCPSCGCIHVLGCAAPHQHDAHGCPLDGLDCHP